MTATAPQAEIAAAPASAPEPTAATPSPAAAVETPATTPPSLDDAAAVDAYLFGGGTPPAEAKPETAPVAAPAPTEAAPVSAPAAETPAGTTPPVVEAPAVTETATEVPPAEHEKVLPNRISTAQFSDTEQRAIAKRKALRDAGEDVPLKECIDLIEREDQQATNAAQVAAQEAANAPNPIADLDGEIEAIQTRLDEMGNDGAVITPEFVKLTRDLAKKEAALAVEKLRAEQQQTAKQAVAENRFTASRQQAVEEFPDAAVGDSLLGAMVTAEISARQSPNHPKHASLSQSDAPLAVTRDVAEKAAAQIAKVTGVSKEQALQSLRGKAPAAPVATPPAAPATVATPTTPAAPQPAAGNVTTAPGSASMGKTTAAPTAAEILQRSRNDPSFDADAYLGLTSTTLFG